ncbi:MAG: RDD family protein [Candidatus Bathyarchaeota archaeon]|nr:RDD family protein [Candidatus Bathyarchaeota archaeon]
MVYCKKCGRELNEGEEYCPSCGAGVNQSELMLATWGERFMAWILDIILVGILAGIVRPFYFWSNHFPFPFIHLSINSMLLFLYWAYLEGTQGQSLGKKAMRIKVVDLQGDDIDMGTSMYQAIGKAFLAPLDVLVGWLLYPNMQQRLFNNLSRTVVVKE